MSLDVYLSFEQPVLRADGSGIFVRENGTMREIPRDEWDQKFPGVEPVTFARDEETRVVYSANITHNLGDMAKAAGIYKHLWRPEEIRISRAEQLIEPLTEALKRLTDDPHKFIPMNPPNGWGDYPGLVEFVANYLQACRKYPQATIGVSR